MGDKHGAIAAKIWDWDPQTKTAFDIGTILNTSFEFSPFKDSPQIVIRDYTRVDRESVDAGLFIDSLEPSDYRYYRAELDVLISMIKDDNLRSFIKATLDTYPAFLSCPAARMVHHNRLGGLLEHTVHVAKNAIALANAYKGTPKFEKFNTDLLIAGAIVHDLGKIYDYNTDNLTIDYSLPFFLTGQHGTNPALLFNVWLKTEKIISFEVLLGLMHLQLSHHGPEFGIVTPVTLSAWLLHAADLTDARIDSMDEYINGENLISNEKCWAIQSKVVDERLIK